MDALLEMLKTGQPAALPEIAEKLGISVEMVQARLERYELLGYAKRQIFDANTCAGNCKKCSGCSGNTNASPFIYWEKGEKLK